MPKFNVEYTAIETIIAQSPEDAEDLMSEIFESDGLAAKIVSITEVID